MTDPGGWADLSDDELAIRLAGAGCPPMLRDPLVSDRDDDRTASLIDQWFNQNRRTE